MVYSSSWDLKKFTTNLILGLQFLDIGVVSTIQVNNKPVQTGQTGQEVCIKILPIPGQSPRMLGHHFGIQDVLVSKVRVVYRTFR